MSEQTKVFFILLSAVAGLQLLLFLPFFVIWEKDCKKIGKERLAVSLGERFVAWLVCFPFWALPFIYILK